MTFGFAGSNHALATAIYAHNLGLKSISLLMPQINAHYVKKNLLMSYQYNAELHQYRNEKLLYIGAIYQLIKHIMQYGRAPKIIPPGGSSPLGTIGFVNAAFELKKQIDEDKMPKPDIIYVALGTTGTAVGLMLGLMAAKIDTQVIGVRVAHIKYGNAKKMAKLFHDTNRLLHSLDSSFPNLKITKNEINIRHDFFGRQYALFTEESVNAVDTLWKNEGIKLDGTYTGKAFAALMNDIKNKKLTNTVILFWNTYNSKDYTKKVANVDYKVLPKCFYRYFKTNVQKLDGKLPA